jgi:hypothetical protein
VLREGELDFFTNRRSGLFPFRFVPGRVDVTSLGCVFFFLLRLHNSVFHSLYWQRRASFCCGCGKALTKGAGVCVEPHPYRVYVILPRLFLYL